MKTSIKLELTIKEAQWLHRQMREKSEIEFKEDFFMREKFFNHTSLSIPEQDYSEQDCTDFYKAILRGGAQGITKREMDRMRLFTKHSDSVRAAIIKSLTNEGKIDFVIIHKNKQGRLRKSFIAIEMMDN